MRKETEVEQKKKFFSLFLLKRVRQRMLLEFVIYGFFVGFKFTIKNQK
jgi:hypothetical protein